MSSTDEKFLDALKNEKNSNELIADEIYIQADKTGSLRPIFNYLTLISACMTQFVMFGFLNNIGTIKYHWSEGGYEKNFFLEQAGSLNFGFVYFSSIITFLLIDRVGPVRTYLLGLVIISMSLTILTLFSFPVVIFIFYGVFVGTGASLILFSMLYILKEVFQENLSLANGIVSCGSCLGTLVQSQFINTFCEIFGWKILFYIYSITLAVFMTFGYIINKAYVQHVKFSKNLKPKIKSGNSAFLTVIKNHRFVVFCVACFVFSLPYLAIYLYIDMYGYTKGVNLNRSKTLIGYFSLGSLFGRLGMGVLSNLAGRHKITLLTVCFFNMGVLWILSTLSASFMDFVIFCIVAGIFDGGFICLIFPTICDIFRRPLLNFDPEKSASQDEQENMATSICYIIQGFALMVGPIFINLLMPYLKTYSHLFSSSGVILMTSALILSIAPLIP